MALAGEAPVSVSAQLETTSFELMARCGALEQAVNS